MRKYSIVYLRTGVCPHFLLIILVMVVCCCYWPSQAVATSNIVTTKTKGLTLSPLRSELNIAPGTSLDGVITVTNSTDKPMAINLSAEEFSVINKNYDYAFTPESDVARWVRFTPSEANLATGEIKKVTFSVGVPLSAEPGGRYISLFASTNTGASSEGVNSRQRIASLLYITVLGDVTRAGNLISVSSPWLIGGETKFSATVQNTGTTHFRSDYSVKVTGLIGDSIVASTSGSALILPATVRLVSDILPLPKFPGVYKIIYNIGLGDTPLASRTRYALYLPPFAVLAFTAVVVIVIFSILRKRHGKC